MRCLRLHCGGALCALSAAVLLTAVGCDAPRSAPGGEASQVVVLLHGLARTDASMRPLEEPLEAAGYAVRNIHYPSTDGGADELVAFLSEELASCCRHARSLNFVTHSLGGILTRAYIAQQRPANLGRVVMLAPPNHGSEFVDVLGELDIFQWVMGPIAVELGTDADSLPNRLPPVDFELGVIAGTDSVNPLGGVVIPGDSDGTVSVASTQLEGMSDFVIVPASHTFIMFSEEVAQQVVAFLQTGRFVHGGG